MLAFLSSPAYIAKIGCGCAADLFSVISDSPNKSPELMTLFAGEKDKHPDWFVDLSLIPAEEPTREEGEGDSGLPHDKEHLIIT
ncbi:hypothetical protein LIER_17739 [Lithospermum erythrorhizon]|uniref:Uncharacterized protein n=1 Tax=Lithospermum erythrorhizon TaxID=34254 RepID=A0AAV3QD76_LITER